MHRIIYSLKVITLVQPRGLPTLLLSLRVVGSHFKMCLEFLCQRNRVCLRSFKGVPELARGGRCALKPLFIGVFVVWSQEPGSVGRSRKVIWLSIEETGDIFSDLLLLDIKKFQLVTQGLKCQLITLHYLPVS